MYIYFFKFLCVVFFSATLACNLADTSTESVSTVTATADTQVLPTPPQSSAAKTKGTQTAVFAGGCFWGVEAVFEHIKGVTEATSGYSGGTAKTADYEAVSAGETEHAEAVKITYDPSQVSYEQLLKVFFSVAHDPTELNRQGPDTGTQYRSAIFYSNDEQKRLAESYVAELTRAKTFAKPIVTQVAALDAFYAAEDYHQNYLVRNPDQPYIVMHDKPKLESLRKQFPELFIAK